MFICWYHLNLKRNRGVLVIFIDVSLLAYLINLCDTGIKTY